MTELEFKSNPLTTLARCQVILEKFEFTKYMYSYVVFRALCFDRNDDF